MQPHSFRTLPTAQVFDGLVARPTLPRGFTFPFGTARDFRVADPLLSLFAAAIGTEAWCRADCAAFAGIVDARAFGFGIAEELGVPLSSSEKVTSAEELGVSDPAAAGAFDLVLDVAFGVAICCW